MQQINSWKKMLALALTAGVFIVTFSASRAAVSAAGFGLPQGGILDVLERQKAAIVGAWDAPDSTGFQALLTFHADGTLSAVDEDPTATNGHGIWRHLEIGVRWPNLVQWPFRRRNGYDCSKKNRRDREDAITPVSLS